MAKKRTSNKQGQTREAIARRRAKQELQVKDIPFPGQKKTEPKIKIKIKARNARIVKKKKRGGARPGAGRKKKRGPKKGSAGAELGGSKRTKQYKELKAKGVDFSAPGGGGSRPRGQGPFRTISNRPRLVRRLTSGEYEPVSSGIEAMSFPISQRGRAPLMSGLVDPLAKPGTGQPLSAQDYFLLSRAIANAAYDRNRNILEIEFITGAVYHFSRVPQTVWVSFRNAQSKGRAFHHLLYGHWTGQKGSKTYHPKYNEVRIS